mmetsp:Transcript_16833/g.23828  ORF Transcript_16833/g.23828 Transcript_16833/m.23828 type:complete len:877 (-) Transcript_16833:150-2780(-)
MCTVPHQIQSQCSEAISLISLIDFPQNWDNLLTDLVQKFNSPDLSVVNGVLITANSIFKRFRYAERSNSLYEDILYVLQILQAPLLTLFKTLDQAVGGYTNDIQQLNPRLTALRSVCGIFYSLNWQDLPEYFEDHMSEWMEGFSKYLSYQNPLLQGDDDDDEPGLVEKLQAAIVDNIYLYADKDEESFIPFLSNFMTLVWNLLLRVSSSPKYDILATKCIKFLSLLVGKQMHKSLFEDINTLKQIISKIVIPNLMMRDGDEERFEDDPQEFIMSDMEGNDTESRRKCSQDLLRAMCRQFEAETTAICSEHITSMLVEYSSAPSEKYPAKDVAIHLVLGISIRAESTARGVSAINDKYNVMEFFTSHILSELQDSDPSNRPILKACALKFVTTFRNQFTKENITALMPLMISHLSSPYVVVHTYAAAGIEKFLTCKDDSKRFKFVGTDIKPFLEPLFTGLFNIVGNNSLNENEYVMKCIMRSLNTGKDDIVEVVQIVLEKLTAALFVVAKNPRNPQYNHYMFESIAVLVKAVCSVHPEHTSAFEELLFPPFQTVLQMDVSEFTPYVFQILAQLLEYRPQESGLGDSFSMLFPPLLTPALWELKGNIPALTRLLQAYLRKGPFEIISMGQFLGLLGVFQKLAASRVNEVNAFELLGSILHYVPYENLQSHMKSIFQILLMRLQQGKSPRYVRLVTGFFAQYVGKYGSQNFFDLLDSIQSGGLPLMILSSVWIPRLESDVISKMDAKTQVVGITDILCKSSVLLVDNNSQVIWCKLLGCVVKIMTSTEQFNSSATDAPDVDAEIGYDPTFSKLHFASKPNLDYFLEINDPVASFAQAFHNLCVSHPGKFMPIIQQGFQSDPKASAGLESILNKAGLQII